MSKHYIRIDENNNIIAGFSDQFMTPELNDICINENGGRHFLIIINREKIINPVLVNTQNKWKYKYIDGKVVNADNVYTEKEKRDKIKEIKLRLLNSCSYLTNLCYIQEYLHDNGINKKNKIIEKEKMEKLYLWIEEIMTIEDKIQNWDNLSFNDISENNNKLFPVFPIEL
jgi:hypothetical protein